MINTKPNSFFKFIFFFGIFLGISSCNTKESFTFEKQNLTVDALLDCTNIDCASLDINLLKIIEDNEVSRDINKEIESVVCAILNIGESESEESLQNAVRQFNSSYQEMSEKFPEETIPYEANIDSELSFQCATIISILIDSYIFTGGAHGYGGVSFINVDAKTGKRLSNKELFKKHSEFERYAEKAFRKEKNIPENESINSTGFFFENDKFVLPENIGFTESEMILYYNPYEISSYAEGAIELKFPKEEVASFCALEIR